MDPVAVDIRAWANRVSQPKTFLEFPDFLLFAMTKKFPLQLMVYAEGSKFVGFFLTCQPFFYNTVYRFSRCYQMHLFNN